MKRLLLLLTILLLISCSSRDNVIPMNFSTTIDPEQNLVFKFKEDVVDLDENPALASWQWNNIIKITPQVPGKYKWQTNNILIFAPAKPFAPGNEYKIEIPEYKFSTTVKTPNLRIVNATSYTAKVQNKMAIALTLTFNFKPQEDLKYYLEVYFANKKQNIKLISNSDLNTVVILPDADVRKEGAIKIVLKKGAKCQLCAKPIDKNLITELPYEGLTPFVGQDVKNEFVKGEPVVRIIFSAEISPNIDAKKYIKIKKQREGYFDFISNKKEDRNIDFVAKIDRNNIILKSHQFIENRTYEIKIKNLPDAFNRKLEEDFVEDIKIKAKKPYLKFKDSKGIYLRKSGLKNIALKIVGMDNIKLSVYKIYNINLLHFLNRNLRESYMTDGAFVLTDYEVEQYGDKIFGATYSIKDLKKVNNYYILNIDGLDTKKNNKGIYLISVENVNRSWDYDLKLVSISDIGISFKETDDEFIVLCNSLKTGEPLSGVTVNLISKSNISLKELSTNSDGIVKVNKNELDNDVNLIFAEKDKDANFIYLKTTEIDYSKFDIAGKEVKNNDIFILGERFLYKPGETAKFAFLLRNKDYNSVVLPVKISIKDPSYNTVFEKVITPNTAGAGEFEYKIPQVAKTGKYIIQTYIGDEMITQKPFKVEEFNPERTEITINAPKKIYELEKPYNIEIIAKNLYGTPATNRRVNVSIEMQGVNFQSKKFKDYTFALKPQVKLPITEAKLTTDFQGKAVLQLKPQEDYKNHGIISANIYATVEDDNGNVSRKATRTNIITQPYFIGIKQIDPFITSAKKVSLPIVVVNDKGQKVTPKKPVVVELRKVYWYEYWGGGYYDEPQFSEDKKTRLVFRKKLKMNSPEAMLNFDIISSGTYEVRVYIDKDAPTYVFYTLEAWFGWASDEDFAPETDGTIKISTNKDKYSEDDKAQVIFSTPFDGKLLVTLENFNTVLKSEIIDVKNGSAKWSFDIDEEYIPNIFINAVLIKEKANPAPYSVARGVKKVIIEPAGRKIKTQILTQDKIRSNTKQTIKIKTEPNTFVAISVVDKGILQVSKEGDINPFKYFYAPRKLGVKTYDLYSFVLPEYQLEQPGGGFADLEDINAQDLLDQTLHTEKSVAFWSGIKKANGSGIVEFPIYVEDYTGKLVVRTATFDKNKKFGYAEKNIIVSNPVNISVGTPDFLVIKDKPIIPLRIANTTDKQLNASINIKHSKNLQIQQTNSFTLTLNPNSETLQEIPFEALKTGLAFVEVSVKANGEIFKSKKEFTIKDPSRLKITSGYGVIENKGTITISPADYAEIKSMSVAISGNPAAGLIKSLDFLLQYPYGCLEQTTSKAFAQLYYEDLAELTAEKDKTGKYIVKEHITDAIEKMKFFITPRGGMSLWPDGYNPDPWATIYATHFLTEAKKKGYSVPENITEENVNYINDYISTTQTYINFGSEKLIRNEIPYGLFVVANYDPARINSSMLQYASEHYNDLTPVGKYLIAATYKKLGEDAEARKLLPKSTQQNWKANYYDYGTTLRNKALALYCLAIVDENNPQTHLLLNEILGEFDRKPYYTTQEAVFSLLAVKEVAKEVPSYIKIRAGSVNKKISGTEFFVLKNPSTNNINISADGKVYYSYVVKGKGTISEASSNGFALQTSFYDKFGNRVSPQNIKLGDLLVVKIDVQNTSDYVMENVAITTMLPAGFQIENPRLFETLKIPNFKNDTYKHIDYRKDRVNIFTSLYNGQRKSFFYLVRVVRKGEFNVPGATVLDMYSPMFNAYTKDFVVRVVGEERL